MRQIMTACLLSALSALPAWAENLLDGSYLITSVAPVSADAGADIADDLLESARASWLVVMDHEMRAYRLDEPGATLTILNDDFTAMVGKDGTVVPVEVLDGNEIAVTISLLGDYRAIFRRVDADNPQLLQLQAEREAALPGLGDAAESLASIVAQRSALDLRMPLAGGEASIALPAYLALTHDDGAYQGWPLEGDHVDDWSQMTLYFPEDPAEVDRIYAEEAERLTSLEQQQITIDSDAIAAADAFANITLLARGEVEGRRYVMFAITSRVEFPVVMAMRDSIMPPIDRAEKLRDFDLPLPKDLLDQAAFDSALDQLLTALAAPETLLTIPAIGPDDTGPAAFAPELNLVPQDGFNPIMFTAGLFPGTPAEVLKRFTGTLTDQPVTIRHRGATCQAIAALPVSTGADAQPLTLILQQRPSESFNRCLLQEKALGRFDLDRVLMAEIPVGLAAQIGQYSSASDQRDGSFVVKRNDKKGLISATGEVLIPLEYDRIVNWDSGLGYVVTKNDQQGYFGTDGREIIPIAYDEVDTRKDVIIVTRAEREGAFLPDGTLLLEPAYLSVFQIDDTPLLHVTQGQGVGLFSLESRSFVVPPSDGWTSFDAISSQKLQIARNDQAMAIFDHAGKLRLGPAARIELIKPGRFIIQQEAEGPYRFFDLDGNRLGNGEYVDLWADHVLHLIRVTDADGRTAYLDFDLKAVTPDGFNAVYQPSDGGYSVVSRIGEKRPMALAAPDGKLVLDLVYPQIFPVRDGIVSVMTAGGLWGVYDRDGNEIQAPKWQRLSQSFDGHLYAMEDDLWRQIDREGNVTDPRRWHELIFSFRGEDQGFMGGRLAVDAAGQLVDTPAWEVLDLSGKRLLDGVFPTLKDDFGTFILSGPDGTRHYPE